ncbi:kinase [Rossellomorea marisflavi]|nr:kinase [Rossellomorea marisflavi]
MSPERDHLDYTANKRYGVGKSYGTFGELLQGVLPNEQNFLVTFPIEKYSECKYYPSVTGDLSITPQGKLKSLDLARKLLSYYDKPVSGHLVIDSELVQGKGLASSTADMIAVSRAIEDVFGMEIPVGVVESFIRDIEPTDGIMHAGIVVYYHKKLELRESLGSCPPLSILALDEGGEIDTIKYNQVEREVSQVDKTEYQSLLSDMSSALRHHDLKLLGRVTTRSAILNQKNRPKKTLDSMREICDSIGGVGVVTAHSGTYIGIILSDDDPDYTTKREIGLESLRQLGYPVEVFNSCSSHYVKKEVPV